MPRASSRQYPERPVLGVGALIIEDNKILLVERGGEPLKGYWSLPGGAVETGETLEQAVRREVLEETGLSVSPVKMVTIFERIMNDMDGRAEYHYVLVDYLCRVDSGEPVASSDVAAVAWVPKHELAALHLTEGTLNVIEQAFAL